MSDHIFFPLGYLSESINLPANYISLLKNVAYLCLPTVIILSYIIKKIRKKHSRTENEFYNLFDSNPALQAIVHTDTLQFLAVNKAGCKFYGYSNSQFLSMTANEVRIDSFSTYPGIQTSSQNCKYSGIKKHKKKNGDIIIVEITSSDVVFKGKSCKLHMVREMTELIKANEAKMIAEGVALQQKNLTEYVLENFPVDVAVFDKNHKYLLLNKMAVKNDQIRKWLIGKDDFDYFRFKNLDMRIAEQRRENFDKAVAGEIKEWVDEYTIEGHQKYMLRKFYPYYEDGELKYVYGYGMDITEVKKAQIRQQAYIQQLETITFATSHKVRQPICNMQGLISLLNMGDNDQHELKVIIDSMTSSIQILDEYTRELGVKLQEYKKDLNH